MLKKKTTRLKNNGINFELNCDVGKNITFQSIKNKLEHLIIGRLPDSSLIREYV